MTGQRHCQIAGTGAAVPATVLPSARVEANLGLEPGWIAARTGVRERRMAGPEEATSDLAVAAGAQALELADRWLRAPGALESGAVLVIGANVLSRRVNWSDRNTAALFGDGAGAVVLRPADVDHFIPHQANARLVAEAARLLGIAPERTVINVDRYGNTSAATIPLALHEVACAGRLRSGDLVLLAAVGGGMTAGAAVLRWGEGN